MTKHVIMKSLSDSLEMEPLYVEDIEPKEDVQDLVVIDAAPEQSKEDQEAEADFYEVRDNYKKIIKSGDGLVQDIARIASGSETPRAFEVAGKLLKDMADINSNLLELHEKRRQIIPPPAPVAAPTPNSVTNIQAFVGTTAELLALIKTTKKKVAEEDSQIIEHD
jgi:hypothetical protein